LIDDDLHSDKFTAEYVGIVEKLGPMVLGVLCDLCGEIISFARSTDVGMNSKPNCLK
jgi:hypothetical protein